MARQLPIQTNYRIMVGAYWFGSAEYGGLIDCKSFKDAESEAAQLRKHGYEKPGISEVRILERTLRVYRPKESFVHERAE
jgi:hypothetical protein